MSAHFNLPNSITWLRIALIPLFVVAFLIPIDWARPVAAGIFALAGITDWLDGYLARRLNQMSGFGAFLDPVADKLMVSTALVLIVATDSTPYTLPLAFSAAVIIGREITVSALREWMAQLGEHGRVRVSWVGKYKTAFQIVALIMMIYEQPVRGIRVYDVGLFLLVFAAGLTLWSMFRYLRGAWPVLRAES